jgi:alanyl-tRNA synthetase
MNQFKDVFTGKRKADYSRATSSQKCLRAGGKHNDLDNVGYTARHHTFFEMLGNFSFGDYYKEEAIVFAWDWVKNEIKLPLDRLYATVYETDDDAFELWGKIAPELKNGRVMRFGKHDNFWSMGDLGPCGPCSEIHFDRGEQYGTGPDDVVNGDTDRFVEIWNLVFMQDDRLPDGSIVPLPKPSVDTGAGLERLAAVVQQTESTYGIDIFKDLISAISDLTGARYKDHIASHHVIADHVRALSFAIADGGGISNEGRGYVLRRILRRAARHGRLLGAHDPFIYRLVPLLMEQMGEAYPELVEKQTHVENVIRSEEESFNLTLDNGLALFNRVVDLVIENEETQVPGAEIFKLYDTYGFPADLTEILAREKGLSVDMEGFEVAMQFQRERSREGSSFAPNAHRLVLELSEIFERSESPIAPSVFRRIASPFQHVTEGQAVAEHVSFEGVAETAVILKETPFYVESGGQVSDTGFLIADDSKMIVTNVIGHQDHIIHLGYMEKGSSRSFGRGNTVVAHVDSPRRWDIMRNHTATHLLHSALREVLGDHVRQSGSYVGPDRLRFDFSHHQPMIREEIEKVERIVNEEILEDHPVVTEVMDLEQARKAGAMALFGEKYAEQVRVVSVPGFSMELCGGTHVRSIGQIGVCVVTLETGIASGIRRLEAITGRGAQEYLFEARRFRADAAALINRPESEAWSGLVQLKETQTALQRDLKIAREEMFSGGSTVGQQRTIGNIVLTSHDFGETDRETMGAWLDSQKEASDPVVGVAVGTVNGKRTVVIAASTPAVKKHDIHAGTIAREVLPKLGGRGGGKPAFAQGGIEDSVSFETAVKAIADWLGEKRS